MASWDYDPRRQNEGSVTTRKDLSWEVKMGTYGPIHQSVVHLWEILQWEVACVAAYLSQQWCTQSFVIHTFLICQISHNELPIPIWVKSKYHRRQVSGSVPGPTSF